MPIQKTKIPNIAAPIQTVLQILDLVQELSGCVSPIVRHRTPRRYTPGFQQNESFFLEDDAILFRYHNLFSVGVFTDYTDKHSIIASSIYLLLKIKCTISEL